MNTENKNLTDAQILRLKAEEKLKAVKKTTKQVIEAEFEVVFQADQVIFCSVEGFFDMHCRENGTKQREVTQCQRIDQVISLTGGKLDQAHLFTVCKQAVRLSINSDDRLVG